MKRFSITALLLSLSFVAVADVKPSSDQLDQGIVTGALFSKTTKVKAGKYSYAVIAANMEEPACNPIQAIVRVHNPDLEGSEGSDGSVIYNLGIQVTNIASVTVNGKNIIIAAQRSDTENCERKISETYAVQYTGNSGILSVKRTK
jgi:hypothetical protein